MQETELSKLIDLRVFDGRKECVVSYTAREGKLNCNLCKDVAKSAKNSPDTSFINAFPGAGINYNRGVVILTDTALKPDFKTMTPGVGKFYQEMLKEHGINNYYALPNIKCELSALGVKETGKVTSNCLELSRQIIRNKLQPKVVITDDVATFNHFTGMKFLSAGKVVNHVMWSSDLNCYMLLLLNVHMYLAEEAQSREKQKELIKLNCLKRSFTIVSKILNGTYEEQIIRCEKTDYQKVSFGTPREDFEKVMDLLESQKKLALDIETEGKVEGGGLRPWDSRITMLSITHVVGKSFVFPWKFVEANRERFQRIFGNKHITKIFANGSFDISHMTYAGFTFVGPFIDILVWNYLYRNGIDYDQNILDSYQSSRAKSRDTNTLKFLSRVYTDLGVYEKAVKEAGGIVKAQTKLTEDAEESEIELGQDPKEILFESLMKQDVNPESKLQLSDAAHVEMVGESNLLELNMVEKYAAADTDATFRVEIALSKKLDKELMDFYWMLMEPLIFEVIVPIYLSGIRVDLTYLNDLERKYYGDGTTEGEMQQIEGQWRLAMKHELLASELITPEKILQIYKTEFKNYESKTGQALPTDKAELIEVLDLNINSPTKILNTYKALGYLTSDAKSVDGAVLTHLVKQGIQSAKYKAAYQPVSKLYTTYVKAIKDKQIDGFIHCIFNTFFTTTGRLSSSDPNMQNIPASNLIKNIFVPREGYSFLDLDYSQAELRVVAEYANEQTFIDAYLNRRDIHWDMTMKMFNITYPYRPEKKSFKHITELAKFLDIQLDSNFTEENWESFLKQEDAKTYTFPESMVALFDTIKKWDKLRGFAKTLNFSILYGSSEYGLARNIYKDTYDYVTDTKRKEYLAECKGLLESWFKAVPNIKKWLEDNFEYAKKAGYVKTIFGRRRYLVFSQSNYWKFQNSARREAGNTPIQSTASDICCLAAIGFQRFINLPEHKGDDCRIVNIVHDNILAEVPDAKAKYYFEALKKIMEHDVNPLKKVPLEVDGSITKRWSK